MHSPVNEHLGVETIDREDGSVELRLVTRPEHRNEIGLVHGGIVSFLLDGAMGRAVGRTLGPGGVCATVQLSVQFLAPASGALAALAHVTRRGRSVAFAESECRDGDGQLVARAHGTWAVR